MSDLPIILPLGAREYLKRLAPTSEPKMNFSPAFFDLQLQFAKRVAALTGDSLEDALLRYTNMYVRFGCGSPRDPSGSRWQAYIDGTRDEGDVLSWTYEYWRKWGQGQRGPELSHRVGCFGYTFESKKQLRLHFVAPEDMKGSPLAPDTLRKRAGELRRLLAHVPPEVSIVGRSWLYNLQRYRSLFPDDYLASAVPVPDAWARLPLWGQFLHADGNVRSDEAKRFLRRLTLTKSASDLPACFRYQVLSPSGPAGSFHRPTRRSLPAT